MLPESPASLLSTSTRSTLMLVLVAACAGQQRIPTLLPPDFDVAGVDTVLLSTSSDLPTVAIHTRYPAPGTSAPNMLVITPMITVGNYQRVMTRHEICSHPDVRCFVSTAMTDDVCVGFTAATRPSILIRHMDASTDYYVTNCPMRPNYMTTCEQHHSAVFVCVRGRISAD